MNPITAIFLCLAGMIDFGELIKMVMIVTLESKYTQSTINRFI